MKISKKDGLLLIAKYVTTVSSPRCSVQILSYVFVEIIHRRHFQTCSKIRFIWLVKTDKDIQIGSLSLINGFSIRFIWFFKIMHNTFSANQNWLEQNWLTQTGRIDEINYFVMNQLFHTKSSVQLNQAFQGSFQIDIRNIIY